MDVAPILHLIQGKVSWPDNEQQLYRQSTETNFRITDSLHTTASFNNKLLLAILLFLIIECSKKYIQSYFLQKEPNKVKKLKQLILNSNFKGYNFHQKQCLCLSSQNWLILIFVSKSPKIIKILTTLGRKTDLKYNNKKCKFFFEE